MSWTHGAGLSRRCVEMPSIVKVRMSLQATTTEEQQGDSKATGQGPWVSKRRKK